MKKNDTHPRKKRRNNNGQPESPSNERMEDTGEKQYIDDPEDDERKVTREANPTLDPVEASVYREALQVLNRSGINYAVGASFARHAYTGIWRATKDLDIFLKPVDLKTALQSLREAGFETSIEAVHWLAKAKKEGFLVDLIFGTGHGHLPIDDSSFEQSQMAEVLSVPTRLIPIEEMIASAIYIAERRRFDGGEVIHLIKSKKGKIDWQRVLNRLGDNRELLLWHLILFDFVYPGHSDYLPQELMLTLFEEMRQRWKNPKKDPKEFRGSLLDPFAYTVDIQDWGYEDKRNLRPLVTEEGDPL